MANVQKENGYTKIAHEMLEALALFCIPPDLLSVLLVILRKTWGWDKKEDRIAVSSISHLTGIRPQHVCRALKKLKTFKMIERDEGGLTRLQKDYDKWELPKRVMLPKQVILPKQVTTVTQAGNKMLPKQGDSIDKKETYKRNIPKGMHAKRVRPLRGELQTPSTQPEPMNQNLDHSFPRKRLYGDERLNWFLDFWEHVMPNGFVESEKWAKIYVRHLLNKVGARRLREVIEWVSDPDCWWYSKLTGFKMLYYKRDQVFQAMSEPKKEPPKKRIIHDITDL